MKAANVIHPTAELSELYKSIDADLRGVERIFDDELVSDVAFVNRLCEHIRAYRGKLMRPALLLLSAEATGGIRSEHCTLGAVVEMVHMATLVHDDVLDDADERRRQPTIGSMSGNVAAVLLGDYLISHAFHLCSSLDSQLASRRIGATTNIVCEGELLQNMHKGNFDITEDEYFEIIRRKTGALTAVSSELGAVFSGARQDVVSAMHAYGMAAGVAFQIVDDVLDITGDPASMGKTLGLDLRGEKLTLPTIHFLANVDATQRASFQAQWATGDVPNNLDALLKESGSIEYSLSAAAAHIADAVRQLDGLPAGPARESLTALAEFILQRPC